MSAAAALAAASETPRIALAPRRPLLGVPSSSIIVSSSAPCSAARAPFRAAAISPLTLPTARETPLPSQASPPSRSSTASNSPVEAPDGTAARPLAPDSSTTSTSTVGLPRESRIWRAWMEAMALTGARVYRRPGRRGGPAEDLFGGCFFGRRFAGRRYCAFRQAFRFRAFFFFFSRRPRALRQRFAVRFERRDAARHRRHGLEHGRRARFRPAAFRI